MVDTSLLIFLYAIQGQTLGGYRSTAYRVVDGIAYLLEMDCAARLNKPNITKKEQDQITALANNCRSDKASLKHHSLYESGTSDDEYRDLALNFLKDYGPHLRDLQMGLFEKTIAMSVSLGTPGLLRLMGSLDDRTIQIITLSTKISNIHRSELWEYYKYYQPLRG